MSNAFDHENTIYFGFGEAEPVEASFTDEDWAEYDAAVAAEMDRYDAMAEDGLIPFYPEDDMMPPF